MIGFILGTSEGKDFLRGLKDFQERIVVSTATEYGGELLSEFNVAHINTKPLDEKELKEFIKKFNLKVLVDASHPYAKNVSENALKACKELKIEYIRYERSGVLTKLEDENIIRISSLQELKNIDSDINGTLLNTTGSNGIKNILNLNLKNRVIHRVLPSIKVMNDIFELGVRVEDIIAIKGPIGYELNKAFIKEYNAKALLTKDSGIIGGALEKAKAALDSNIKLVILEKPKVKYGKSFSSIDETINYTKRVLNRIC